MNYDEVTTDSKSLNETKDCAVRAVAIVTGKPYKVIHALMAKHGRKPRRGTPTHITFKVLAELGVSCIPVVLNAKTVRHLPNLLPNGKFLVRTYSHMLACVDGKVLDWTEGRRHRPKQIYRIT